VSPKKPGPGVFDQKPSGKRSKKKKDRRPDHDRADRSRAARPLADYKTELARARQRPRQSLVERLGGAFPLFGVIGVRELGLVVAIAGGTIAMWPLLRPWGFLVAVGGFLIMRYGGKWLGRSGEE